MVENEQQKVNIVEILNEKIKTELSISKNYEKSKEIAKQNFNRVYNASNDNLRSVFSTAILINPALDVGVEDMFVNRQEYNFNVAKVYFDIKKYSDKIALSKGRNQNLGYHRNEDCSFERIGFEIPIIKEQYHINYASLLTEQFGAVCNDNRAAISFMVDRVSLAIISLMNSVKRNMKFQAYEQIQYGKTDFSKINSNIDTLEVGRDSALTKTVTASWATASTDILKDLSDMVTLVYQKGGANVNVILMGKNAQANFLKNTGIKSLFDIRRFDFGLIKPTAQQGQAYNVFGSISVNGRNILLATPKDEFYSLPGSSTEVSYFGDDNVVFLDDTRMDARAYFGAVEMFDGTDFSLSINNLSVTNFNIGNLGISTPGQVVAVNGYRDQGSENLIINLQTAPAMIVANPNATALLVTKP